MRICDYMCVIGRGGQEEGRCSILVLSLKIGAFGVESGKRDFAPRLGTVLLPIFMFHRLDFAQKQWPYDICSC